MATGPLKRGDSFGIECARGLEDLIPLWFGRSRLLHSAFDVFGKIDRVEASKWLDRLLIPESTDHLEELIATLKKGSSRCLTGSCA